MNQQQLTAAALFGSGGVPTAVSPYGVGLGMPAAAPPSAGPVAAAPGLGFFPGFIPSSFWTSSGLGLILLFVLVAYFDLRLLNR